MRYCIRKEAESTFTAKDGKLVMRLCESCVYALALGGIDTHGNNYGG